MDGKGGKTRVSAEFTAIQHANGGPGRSDRKSEMRVKSRWGKGIHAGLRA